MMSEVREALEGCELILMIVDAKKKWDRADAFVLDLAKKSGHSGFFFCSTRSICWPTRANCCR